MVCVFEVCVFETPPLCLRDWKSIVLTFDRSDLFCLRRDFTIYDAVVNENASKQQYHWLKEEK